MDKHLLSDYLSGLAFDSHRDTEPYQLLRRFAASCIQIPDVVHFSFERAPHEVRLRLQVQREDGSDGAIEAMSGCVAGRREWGTLTVRTYVSMPFAQTLVDLLAQQLAMAFHHQWLIQQRDYWRASVRSCKADLSARKLLQRATGIVARDASLPPAQAETAIRNQAKENRIPVRAVAETILVREGLRKAGAIPGNPSKTHPVLPVRRIRGLTAPAVELQKVRMARNA